MSVDLQACTRQFFNIVHAYTGCMLSSIFMLLGGDYYLHKTRNSNFTYLQIKLLLRTRLPHMTSSYLEINSICIQFKCACAMCMFKTQ